MAPARVARARRTEAGVSRYPIDRGPLRAPPAGTGHDWSPLAGTRSQGPDSLFSVSFQEPGRFLLGIEPDLRALTEHRGRRLVCRHRGVGQVAIEDKWLRQTVFKLLTNALGVSPADGRITLRSEIDAAVWRVCIEDQGPGLAGDQYERAFERFVRFHVPSGEDRGSGLGLAICRSIIDLHGARIYAAPGNDGIGLRVTFELPATAATAAHLA